MPYLTVNGANIYYEEHGQGEQTIVFAHGLLWSGQMYEAQVAFFKQHYRCITFDFRAQGRSQATESGYDMDTLAADALALIIAEQKRQPTIEARVTDIEQVTTEVITALNEKGIVP